MLVYHVRAALGRSWATWKKKARKLRDELKVPYREGGTRPKFIAWGAG